MEDNYCIFYRTRKDGDWYPADTGLLVGYTRKGAYEVGLLDW